MKDTLQHSCFFVEIEHEKKRNEIKYLFEGFQIELLNFTCDCLSRFDRDIPNWLINFLNGDTLAAGDFYHPRNGKKLISMDSAALGCNLFVGLEACAKVLFLAYCCVFGVAIFWQRCASMFNTSSFMKFRSLRKGLSLLVCKSFFQR